MQVRNKVDQNSIDSLAAQLASTSALVADRTALYNQNEVLKKLLNRVDSSKRTLAGVLQPACLALRHAAY